MDVCHGVGIAIDSGVRCLVSCFRSLVSRLWLLDFGFSSLFFRLLFLSSGFSILMRGVWLLGPGFSFRFLVSAFCFLLWEICIISACTPYHGKGCN